MTSIDKATRNMPTFPHLGAAIQVENTPQQLTAAQLRRHLPISHLTGKPMVWMNQSEVYAAIRSFARAQARVQGDGRTGS